MNLLARTSELLAFDLRDFLIEEEDLETAIEEIVREMEEETSDKSSGNPARSERRP